MTNFNQTYRLGTRVIHEAVEPEKWQGSTRVPIYQTAAHEHETAESLSLAFAGKSDNHIYSRLTNPTNRALERKLAGLENGKGAIVMASGMGAISNTCMALLRAGDSFVSGRSLFMSTYLLFTNVFKKFGISVRYAAPGDTDTFEKAIDDTTRFIYIETIGNPAMDIPDIAALAALAHRHGLPLLVDNTLATPYLVNPLDLGADAVIHSTTKFISGHGHAPGGVVVDGGHFDWSSGRFPDFKPFVDRKGDLALLDKIWREHHVNFGATQAPFHSYLTLIGLDTFVLRMERHIANAQVVASFLQERPEVAWVNYPGMPDHPFHDVGRRQFDGRGFGSLMTFGLKNMERSGMLIDTLDIVTHAANLGDCRTLIIHPWSTQYVAFEPEKKTELGIHQDLLRLSVGIEDVNDIMDDLDQALKRI